MSFAGEFQDFRCSVNHVTEIRPFPNRENKGNFLSWEPIFGAYLLAYYHQETFAFGDIDFGLLGKQGELLANPVSYRDKRTQGMLKEVSQVIPEEEISEGLKQPAPPVPPVKKAAPVETAKPAVTAKPPKPVAPVVTTTAKQAKPPTGSYYLQVGSFKNGVQAERFRAELALQGMQTNIQTVTINNKDTYHRVRVGPFYSFEALDKTRQKLKKKGIESTPIKITG